MAPQKRQPKQRRHHAVQPPARAKQAAAPKGARPPGGSRGWLLRVGLALSAPILFLLCAELLLWGLGVGTPATFFVASHRPQVVTTNQMFIWFFRPQRSTGPDPRLIRNPKPEKTLRVFVLGGSAAMGTPKPSYGFARILELMLQDHFSEQQVEVINAAVRGINSHVVLPIARECARLQPDIMIVYSGNNDHRGRYGVDTILGRHPDLIPLLHAAKRPRISQALRRALQGSPDSTGDAAAKQSMETFRENRRPYDAPEQQLVYRNFRDNLVAISRAALERDAEVLLLTLPVNLRDCPPLGSLHRADLPPTKRDQWASLYESGITQFNAGDFSSALSLFREAATIDDHYAELHFRLGQTHLALAETEAAKTHFLLARDRDAIQFRADTRLNDTIKEVAEQFNDHRLHLIDVASLWHDPDLSAQGIPGFDLFTDHVHFNFKGDYEMAMAILPQATAALEQRRGLTRSRGAMPPTIEQCAQRLAYTDWDHIELLKGIARMTAVPPFLDQLNHDVRQKQAEQTIATLIGRLNQATLERADQTYVQAIAARPEDWNLRFNYANFLYAYKRYPETMKQMQKVVETYPDIASFRILLGYSQMALGLRDQAMAQFRHALSLGTHNDEVKKILEHYER